MSRVHDVAVAGGGPAGLALAAAAARRGLDVVVIEPRLLPVDKACGEGLLPAGVEALGDLGALPLLGPGDATPVRSLRWLDPSGRAAEAALRAPGGLGVRRTALSGALEARARAEGAAVVRAMVAGHARGRDAVELSLAAVPGGPWPGPAPLSARVLVAADGLGSPVRRREGLDAPAGGPGRLGLRRHLEAAAPEAVEVHLGDGVEAYLTPAGAGRLGVAFLFERRHAASWEALLAGFPALRDRLAGAAPASEDRGAGPLARRARARVRHRLALLGDAAGALDPLTGAGLTLALRGALDLAGILPEAVARGGDAGALERWEGAWRRRFVPAAAAAAVMLWLARHPAARRGALALAARRPAAMARLVAALG